MCYAAIALVTDYDSRRETEEVVPTERVMENPGEKRRARRANRERLGDLVGRIPDRIKEELDIIIGQYVE